MASSVQEAARFRSPGGPVDQALLVLRVQAGQRAFPPLRGWGREGIGMVRAEPYKMGCCGGEVAGMAEVGECGRGDVRQYGTVEVCACL